MSRSRCGNRSFAWSWWIWFLHGAIDQPRLYHDAKMSSQHLPRRYSNPRSCLEKEVWWKARIRHQLFLHDCRRGWCDHPRSGLETRAEALMSSLILHDVLYTAKNATDLLQFYRLVATNLSISSACDKLVQVRPGLLQLANCRRVTTCWNKLFSSIV